MAESDWTNEERRRNTTEEILDALGKRFAPESDWAPRRKVFATRKLGALTVFGSKRIGKVGGDFWKRFRGLAAPLGKSENVGGASPKI